MTNRKIRKIRVILLLICTILAGCSFYIPEETKLAESREVNLTVYTWRTDREDMYWKLLEQFNREHAGTTATLVTYSENEYFDMLSSAIQTGNAPDLFATGGTTQVYLKQYARMNACLPLSGKLELKDLNGIRSWGKIDGADYMTTTDLRDVYVVYYDKQIFKEHSISAPVTWNDMLNICDQLQESGITPFSMAGLDQDYIQRWFSAMAASCDPDFNNNFAGSGNDFTSKKFLNLIQELVNFRDKGYFGDEYSKMDASNAYMDFKAGKTSMAVGKTWQVNTFRQLKGDDLGAFLWPMKDGRLPDYAVPATDTSFSVYSQTRYPQEALELAKYLMSQESMEKLLSIGNAIPFSGTDLEVSDPLLNEIAAGDHQVILFSDKISRYAKKETDPNAVLRRCLQDVLLGVRVPVDAAAVMQNAMDKALLVSEE